MSVVTSNCTIKSNYPKLFYYLCCLWVNDAFMRCLCVFISKNIFDVIVFPNFWAHRYSTLPKMNELKISYCIYFSICVFSDYENWINCWGRLQRLSPSPLQLLVTEATTWQRAVFRCSIDGDRNITFRVAIVIQITTLVQCLRHLPLYRRHRIVNCPKEHSSSVKLNI